MQIVTPPAETAYLYLFKPQPAMEAGKPDQYSVTLLWPEGSKKLKKLEAAILETAEGKWGKKAKKMLESGQLRNPLRPGSDKEGTNAEEEFAGKTFMTIRSTDKPQVVDEDLDEVLDQMEVYSGCIGRADVYLFPYDKAGNKGVGAIINSFQKLKDGERKSGRRPAESAFGELDEEDEELM